jgi:Mrp family chromosome partitioning ATPase
LIILHLPAVLSQSTNIFIQTLDREKLAEKTVAAVSNANMSEALETPVSRRLASVKNIIIVLSGKGGVGKSSSSVQLALSLLNTSPSARVGLLDLDITGPSLPRMVGLDLPGASVHQSSSGWVPVYVDQGRRLGVMSIGFLLKDRGDSVVWRGPKKDGMIRQFLSEVRWGDLDYLVIDTPPGESSFGTQKMDDETDCRHIR